MDDETPGPRPSTTGPATPGSGGRWIRDPKTGALSRAPDDDAAGGFIADVAPAADKTKGKTR